MPSPINNALIFGANSICPFIQTSLTSNASSISSRCECECCLCREEEDTNHTYSVVTRVPVGFKGRLSCFRLEQSYKVGPLEVNRETVFRTRTSLQNNRTLFTDNNGYQMMKRTYKAYANNTVARVKMPHTYKSYQFL